MRISDWSSDVCSSDLSSGFVPPVSTAPAPCGRTLPWPAESTLREREHNRRGNTSGRSEEHTSELQSLMRISYAVFCLKKKHTRDHLQVKSVIKNSHPQHK